MRPHVDQLARDLLEDLGLIPDDGAQIPPPAFAAGHREIGQASLGYRTPGSSLPAS